MLDKVEITELLLEKFIAVLEAKGNLDQLRNLLPMCFDRSVIYFIFTHDQDLFEGQGGQMPYFPDSRLPKVSFSKSRPRKNGKLDIIYFSCLPIYILLYSQVQKG